MNYDRFKKKQKMELVVKLIAIMVLFKKLKKNTHCINNRLILDASQQCLLAEPRLQGNIQTTSQRSW